jgi:dTDP-4-dehydrorhamnose reductase
MEAALVAEQPWAVLNAVRFGLDATRAGPRSSRSRVDLDAALAALCRRADCAYLTFSSDAVFDGRARRPYLESDAPTPETDYGAECREVESLTAAMCPRALLVRTGPLFGSDDGGEGFADRILAAVLNRDTIAAPVDITVSPSLTSDVLHAALDLLIDDATGVWHVVNAGAMSWWEFGRSAAETLAAVPELVQPVYACDLPTMAPTPRYAPLASERACTTRPLQHALQAYLVRQEIMDVKGIEACA